jgi:DNA-directed RNA polymerase subunit RPC12/RpoP
MDVLALVASLILIAVVLLLILYPLWQQTRRTVNFQTEADELTLEEYELRYQVILASIRELMFDYEMGKITEADYETLLPEAKLEAATIRQRIDSLTAAPETDNIDPALDAQIEALISQLRNEPGQQATDGLLREVKAEITVLNNIQPDRVSAKQTCPSCGHRLQPADKFCGRCGEAVSAEPTAEVEPETPACPRCGYTHEVGDVFCAQCGSSLAQEPITESLEDATI